ncbi:MAG: hypothetical protein V7672_00850 [Brevundimonas sp.]|uniref:hypothetical protein n=1 Tax=Brevundimonas sp. TaxID=1871086 RepID=UPI0030031E3D
MSVPRIKALTKRIRLRIGTSEEAARQAGLAHKGAWSLYENADHPETTLPIHRFMAVANGAERAELIDLLQAEDDDPAGDLLTEAPEVTEAAADLQRVSREAAADGKITILERRRIRAGALRVKAEADDVLVAVGEDS